MADKKDQSQTSLPGFEENEAPSDESNHVDPIVLPLLDARESIDIVKKTGINITTTIIDPWYNKGVGGERDDYHPWLKNILEKVSPLTENIFIWGFPEIVHKVLDYIPKEKEYEAWLTWYYKNCPSRASGWRPAQMTCIHLKNHDTELYPEHFLNEDQLQKKEEGKLQYVPGPPNVIEESLLVGFVGEDEQTGHPSQKPYGTIKPLIKMSTVEEDTVFDPFCGSGTTGAVARDMNRKSIIADNSSEYLEMAEKRLNVERLSRDQVEKQIKEYSKS